LIACLGFSYWGYAWWALPAGFLVVLNAWLEAMAKFGLTRRQLPPPIRRQLALRVGLMTGGYVIAAIMISFVFLHRDESSSTREARQLIDENMEWWFVPYSGAYEKLGLLATFSAPDQPGKSDSETLPPCTVSLIVHRKDAEPAEMKVVLPGLRASYRVPAPNPWTNTFVLDKDSLMDWLHKVAGLDLNAPKFQEEAGQIYGLLKEYQIQPPQTVKEFVNLAKADLRDFWVGGMQGRRFSFGNETQDIVVLVGMLFIASSIYQYLVLWATRRAYSATLTEIAQGRWTPPKAATPFPATVKVLIGLLVLSMVCSLARFRGAGDLDAGTTMVNLCYMLIVNLGLAMVLISALRRHAPRQNKPARGKGLLFMVVAVIAAIVGIVAADSHWQIGPNSAQVAKAGVPAKAAGNAGGLDIARPAPAAGSQDNGNGKNAVDGEVLASVGFDGVPLVDAVCSMALQANLNIQFDPALLNQRAADGTPISPPTLKEKWKKVTALQALQALLDNHGWQMTKAPGVPIFRITAQDPDAVGSLRTRVNLMEKAQTNGAERDPVIPMIAFDAMPVMDLIRALALQANLNIQFDPRLSNWNFNATAKWRNVTARQALQALLDNNGLQMTQLPGNPILRVTAKNP